MPCTSPFDDILLPRDLPLACGVVCHAPSVFHGWALESLESPYVEGGASAFEDFAVAALLLSRPAADILAEGLGAGLERLKPDAGRLAEFYARDPDAFKRDSAALAEYLAESFKGLRTRKKTGGGDASALPFCYTIGLRLRMEMGMEDVAALCYPLKRAIIDIQILHELAGGKSLISPTTARLLDEIAERKKAEKAARK